MFQRLPKYTSYRYCHGFAPPIVEASSYFWEYHALQSQSPEVSELEVILKPSFCIIVLEDGMKTSNKGNNQLTCQTIRPMKYCNQNAWPIQQKKSKPGHRILDSYWGILKPKVMEKKLQLLLYWIGIIPKYIQSISRSTHICSANCVSWKLIFVTAGDHYIKP